MSYEIQLRPEAKTQEAFLLDNPLSRIADQVSDVYWRPEAGNMDSFEYSAGSVLLSPLYGQRLSKDELAQTEVCDFAAMTWINQQVQLELLRDERGRIPRLVIPPDIHAKTTSRANNTAWLQHIKGGTWPIMQHEDPTRKTLTPYGHDYKSYHLANMALLPREMQDEITELTYHALCRRNMGDFAVSAEALILPGENPEERDPFAFYIADSDDLAVARNRRLGIDILDYATDDPSYLALIGTLAPLAKAERNAQFEEWDQLGEANIEAKHQAAIRHADSQGCAPNTLERIYAIQTYKDLIFCVEQQRRMITDITNFNMRHREGRNLTSDEQNIAQERHLSGILRVAAKLHGDSDAYDYMTTA